MKTFALIVGLFFSIALSAQDAKQFYDQGIEKAGEGKLEEAIDLFTKSIALQPNAYFAWFNRGIAKNMLGLYEEALLDFEETVKLAPDYKKGVLNRGTSKKRLTNYNGALEDYKLALAMDSNYADAYYNRGLVYEMLGKSDSACFSFNKAKEKGMVAAQKKIDNCNDTNYRKVKRDIILSLKTTSKDKKYGFSQTKPIKVGSGIDGGPANQRVYLSFLRDAQGNPIQYKRTGSCCDYKSENSPFGTAKLDAYEITFKDKKGKTITKTIYISFYDYEEPKVLYGFKTIGL